LDRGYLLVAPTDTERKDWVEALSKAKVHSHVLENIVGNPGGAPEGFDQDDDED